MDPCIKYTIYNSVGEFVQSVANAVLYFEKGLLFNYHIGNFIMSQNMTI